MTYWDLAIGRCCFKSPNETTELIRSAEDCRGDIIFNVTTILPEDTEKLVANIKNLNPRHQVRITESNRDSRYFCQNWGFVQMMEAGDRAIYWGTMDDDTTFLDHKIVEKLYEADKLGFSVLGFMSTSHGYKSHVGYGDIGEYKSLPFVDGHNMFSDWYENMRFGLCDQIGIGNTSYVEVEYCTRMKRFTGEPVLAVVDKTYIKHTFRGDPLLSNLREPYQHRDMDNGVKLFKIKYGIDITPGDVAHFSWESTIQQLNSMHPEKMIRHMVYDQLGCDWKAIYNKFKEDFKDVYYHG